MVNPYVLCLGWVLVHFLWQGAVVALLAWISLRLMSKQPASHRYGVCCAALMVLAMCPIVTFSLQTSKYQEDLMRPVVVVQVPQDSQLAKGSPYSNEMVNFSFDPYLPPLVTIWCLGVFVFSVRLLGGLYIIERFKRKFTAAAPPDLQLRLTHLASRLNIRKAVILRVSERITSPFTVGVLKSIVVIPCSVLTKLSTEQLEVVLLHELAHISRHDYLVNLIQSILETAMFYHPAVWWISQRARIEREHCCDDIVIRTVEGSSFYAHTLTLLEEHRQVSTLSLFATGGPLMNRIRRILGLPTSPVKASTAWATAALLIVMLFAVSSSLKAEAADTTKKKTTKVHSKTTKKAKAKKALSPKVIYVKKANAPKAMTTTTAVAADAPKAMTTTTAAAADAPKAMSYSPTQAAPDGRIRAHFEDTKFSEAISAACHQVGYSFVVAPGSYPLVTVSLDEASPEDGLKAICFAAGATYRVEGKVYYFSKSEGIQVSYKAKKEDFLKSTIDLDLKDAIFSQTMKKIAHLLGISIIVEPGTYQPLTMEMKGVTVEMAFQLLGNATGTSYRTEANDVLYFYGNK